MDAPISPIAVIRERTSSHLPGTSISLSANNNPNFGPSYCGERGDTFVISIRIAMQERKLASVRRTGFRELSAGVWCVIRTQKCDHPSLRQSDQQVLPGDCGAVTVQADEDPWRWPNKITICLTAFNKAARWRALVAMALYRDKYSNEEKVKVLLRGKTCCFDCVIDQASLFAENCFIIL